MAALLGPTQPNRPVTRQLDRAKDPDSPAPFPHTHVYGVAAPKPGAGPAVSLHTVYARSAARLHTTALWCSNAGRRVSPKTIELRRSEDLRPVPGSLSRTDPEVASLEVQEAASNAAGVCVGGAGNQ